MTAFTATTVAQFTIIADYLAMVGSYFAFTKTAQLYVPFKGREESRWTI